MQIVEKYAEWANDYQEDQITVVYDTMWNGTKMLAEKIVEGIGLADPNVTVKSYHLAKSDVNDVITEVFKSKAVVVGSPTINNGILHSVNGFLHMVKQMKFKKKKAAAFGCYGWSGESVKIVGELLQDAGLELINEGFKQLWNPDLDAQEAAVEFGKAIAKA